MLSFAFVAEDDYFGSLPDRGLPHEPSLTAAQARSKVERAMSDSALEENRKITFQDAPARLAYTFEDFGDNGAVGGALVWVFQAMRGGEPIEPNGNAVTGEVIRLVEPFGFLPTRHSYTASYGIPSLFSFPTGHFCSANQGPLCNNGPYSSGRA